MMKRVLLVLTLTLGVLVFQFNDVSARKTLADDDWIIVTSGNQMSDIIKQAAVGQTLNIKASGDLTLGTLVTIPQDVILTIDMDNHALYTTGDNRYYMSSGNKVLFQNEIIVSTTPKNDNNVVPNPNGNGTINSGRYNSYYGLFSTTGDSYQVMPTLTYKDVTQEFATVTNWGSAGQPFYNYGIPIQLSGNNYFNYPKTGQEFVEGAGISVLDGTTQIEGGNTNGYSFVQQTWGGGLGTTEAGIDVAEGADLEINWQSSGTVNGIWALSGGGGSKASGFHIKNYGTLNWKLNQNTPQYFFGFSKNTIPFTYIFGPNSKTNITAPGIFNHDATTGDFNVSIESNADFLYDTGNNAPIFMGNNTNYVTNLNINSASNVRFNTSRPANTTSILGNNVLINLINDETTEGYDIYAYSDTGSELLVPSASRGAYIVNGSFHGHLNDMNNLIGAHVPEAADIVAYQNASQLSFIKRNKKILSFKTVPSDSAMMFKYELDSKLINSILPRNVGDTRMSFDIINTLTDSFSVQANTSNSKFPDGMNFAWKDGSSVIDLDDINDIIFNSSSPNMTWDGHGNYKISYLADEGLLFKSKNAKYQLGDYLTQINWTLVNGIQ